MSKVWFITGSSRGLGRDLAKAVLEAGDRLVATARDPEQLRELVGPRPEDARRAIAVPLDVTRAEDARRAVTAAMTSFGRIDVLVNNAGYANTAAIEDADEADFRQQFETNFFGVFHVTRAALPVMRAQKAGRILNVSSIGGRIGTPGLGSYQSAKWAVEGFSEVLAKEVTPLGIRVTLIEPGGFRTDWGGSSMRLGEPSDPYKSTVGAMNSGVRGSAEASRGDPARAALAIVKIASVEDPPMRLLLGTDAVFLAGAVGAMRAEEDAKWKSLSSTTDFPGMPDFATSPYAKMFTGRR